MKSTKSNRAAKAASAAKSAGAAKSARAKIAAGAICAGIALAVFLGGCNNFFHELIPPDGDRIVSFELPGQIGAAVIGENAISAKVAPGADIRALLPSIGVSPGASLIPVTFDYVAAAFPEIDLVSEVFALHTAADLPGHVKSLIRSTPGFSIPALSMPIDFSGPVNFFVISGQGSVREYTVTVSEYTAEPRILGLRFSKYCNPELISDAVPVFSGSTLRAAAFYPVEMPSLSFALIPSFEILGESLSIGGIEIVSGESAIQFDAAFDVPQARTATVTRGGLAKDYEIIVTFREDPDTVRSITDFRFAWADNPGIAATSVAAIVDDGDFGTITLQVLYSGARPSALIPRFITPGTARVGGALQASGQSAQDFSQALEYRVTSRNLQFSRTYTVRVEFVSLAREAPRMLSFGLSQAHNPGLIRGSSGEIGDGLIVIDVHFGGAAAPETLVPEFSAQGIVAVLGSVQVSGSSPQNFGSRITYIVSCPLDPALRRHYSVQTRLVRDTSSDALITSFGFFPEENPWLGEPMIGRIQQGTITVFGPAGLYITERVMTPRFEATGPVSVSGAAQASGVSGRVFDGPVEYEVTSPNGLHSRSYAVIVRELPSLRIFVDQSAAGHGDGTSWQNAFRCLREAAQAAAMFPGGDPREVWIAAGTYRPSGSGDEQAYFPLSPNVSFVGGFAGWETARGQRMPGASRTVASGDLGGGRRSQNLFGAFGGGEAREIGGDVSFDGIEFSGAGSAISARLSGGARLSVADAGFSDLLGGAVRLSGSSGAEISGARMSGIGGDGIFIGGAYGDIEISAADMMEISGSGIRIDGGSGRRDLSGISGRLIGGDGIAIGAPGNAGIAISGAELRDVSGSAISVAASGAGGIEIAGAQMSRIALSAIRISPTDGNWNWADGFPAISGNVRLSGIRADGIGDGIRDNHGISISLGLLGGGGGGSVEIRDAAVENFLGNAPGILARGAFHVSGAGAVDIINARAENAPNGGTGFLISGSGTVSVLGSSAGNVGDRGISISAAGGIVIFDSSVEGAGTAGMLLSASAGEILVLNGSVRNAEGPGISVSGGAASIEVVNAVVEEADVGMELSSAAAGERRLQVSNAEIRDLRSTGIRIGSVFDRILISGSTIENTGGRGIAATAIGSGARSVNFELRDSAIRNTTAANCALAGTAARGGGVFFDQRPPAGFASAFAVLRTRFEGNAAEGSGGAIYAGASAVTVADSQFKNGATAGNGGAISSGGGIVSVTDSDFAGNRAEGAGGALLVWNSVAAFSVTGANFTDNSSGQSGGAINVNARAAGTEIAISGSRFENSTAGTNGGAVNAPGAAAAIAISGSRFYNSSAGGSGGAIRASGSAAAAAISGSSFENSTAGGWGGAVSIDVGAIAVENSEFANSSAARSGGAVSASSSSADIAISGSRFENSSAMESGGAIGIGGALAVANSQFINSSSGNHGGAIHAWDTVSAIGISGSRFENSRAGGSGGAINGVGAGASFAIADTDFVNSTAAGGNGKIIRLFGTGAFLRSTFAHDSRLIEFDPPSAADSDRSMFLFGGGAEVLFDGCEFVNLRSNSPREAFIFNRIYQSPGHPGVPPGLTHIVRTDSFSLTLRNSDFTFAPGAGMGLLSLHGGQQPGGTNAAVLAPDSLLMDGVTVSGGGGQQPLIRLHNVANGTSTPGAFRFRPNNVFNGVTLDGPQALANLQGAGAIQLANGALPTLVD